MDRLSVIVLTTRAELSKSVDSSTNQRQHQLDASLVFKLSIRPSLTAWELLCHNVYTWTIEPEFTQLVVESSERLIKLFEADPSPRYILRVALTFSNQETTNPVLLPVFIYFASYLSSSLASCSGVMCKHTSVQAHEDAHTLTQTDRQKDMHALSCATRLYTCISKSSNRKISFSLFRYRSAR